MLLNIFFCIAFVAYQVSALPDAYDPSDEDYELAAVRPRRYMESASSGCVDADTFRDLSSYDRDFSISKRDDGTCARFQVDDCDENIPCCDPPPTTCKKYQYFHATGGFNYRCSKNRREGLGLFDIILGKKKC